MSNDNGEDNNMEYRISKKNRQDSQDRDKNRRGSVLRMGQPPTTAHKGMTRKESEAMDRAAARRAAERNRQHIEEVDDE